MTTKTAAAFIALFLSVFIISCSKSSNGEETGEQPAPVKSVSINVGNTTYNLDSLNVIETSLGYYIRATQKGNTNASQGVSIFINAKTSNNQIAYGNASETGKAYVSGNLGSGQHFSSSYTNPTTGNITNSSGGINYNVSNGVLTISYTGNLFKSNGDPISISVSLKASAAPETSDSPNNQFFDFELDGATYNLHSIAAAPIEKGYAITGIAGNNQLITLVINTKASITTVSFGDREEAGKSGAMFNIPFDEVYSTTGYDCGGRYNIHNQGQAKLTSIGNVGGYIEGHISGSAFKSESACDEDERTIESKSFRGFFKIRRLM